MNHDERIIERLRAENSDLLDAKHDLEAKLRMELAEKLNLTNQLSFYKKEVENLTLALKNKELEDSLQNVNP